MIKFKRNNNTGAFISTCVISLSLLLTACGGGAGDESVAGSGEGGIIGTAKVVVKASEVKAKAKGGNSFKANIGTDSKYKLSGLAEDSYLLRVKSGSTYIYSVAHVSEGQTVTSNSHALTDLIIRNWFKQKELDIDTEFDGSQAISKMPSVAEVNAIETAIEGIASQLLIESGITNDVNLIGNTFENKEGDKFSNFLNNNKVVINNNQITLVFTGENIQTISIDGASIKTDFTKDNQNPSIPGQVRALPSGTNEIVVVWEPSSDNRGVAGYNVFRNGELVDTTPYPVYTDTGLSTATNYDYSVEAIDGVGNKSGQSNTTVPKMTLSNPDTVAEGFATDLTSAVNDNDVTLNWNLSGVNDIARFIVKRGLSGMAKSEVAYTTANAFTDFNLADGNYCYTVLTQDAAGNKSAESAESCVQLNSGGTNPSSNSISCSSYSDFPSYSVSTDTTITSGCYRVESTISVNNTAKLIINPGVKLEFDAGKQLTINKGGSMSAVGTTLAPIIFTGREKTPGYWSGIEFYSSNSINNKLDYVTIEYGERNLEITSYNHAPVRFSVKNTIIRQAEDVGIYISDSSAKIDVFENNTLTENNRPITLPAEAVGLLGSTSSFTGNADDTIHVWDQDIVTAQTWKKHNVPYYFRSSSIYNVKAALNIEAGSKFVFGSGAGIEIVSSGSLKAIGTLTNRIIFTGLEESPAYWDGIEFYSSNSIHNQLDYVTIEYGNRNINTTSFNHAPVRFSLKNSVIRQAEDVGVYINDSSVKLDAFENNTLTENSRPITLPAEIVGSLSSTSSFTGNADDTIHVLDQDVDTAQTWKKHDVPYYFRSNSGYSVDAGLTIEAGTKLIFSTGAGLNITATGYLNAKGTASNKIIFTGEEPTQGYWNGIEFYASNTVNNVLDYVTVEYGGNGATGSDSAISSVCFPHIPNRLTISNSTIKDSLGWGVYKYGDEAYGCIFSLSNNTYSNNAKGNVNTP